ncbi:MAG: helix-turn-helix transcriptional regulator [Pseudomonadota bacterium]
MNSINTILTDNRQPPASVQDPLLRSRQVRRMCGNVDPSTIFRWIKTRRFPKPASIVNGRRLWRESEVVAWLALRSSQRMMAGNAGAK